MKLNESKWARWNNPSSNLPEARSYRRLKVAKAGLHETTRFSTMVALAKGRCLEVGCSDGPFLINIAETIPGENHVGVECTQFLIDRGKENAEKEGVANVEFIYGFAESLSTLFPKKRFQTVLLGEVIEHVLFPYIVLREIASVLKKDGQLILSTPEVVMPAPLHLRHYYRDGLRLQLEHFFRKVTFVIENHFYVVVAEGVRDNG